MKYKVVLKKVVHEIVNWFHLIQNEIQSLFMFWQ